MTNNRLEEIRARVQEIPLGAHFIDLRIRVNGEDRVSSADWLKELHYLLALVDRQQKALERIAQSSEDSNPVALIRIAREASGAA
mgnify:FL=1